MQRHLLGPTTVCGALLLALALACTGCGGGGSDEGGGPPPFGTFKPATLVIGQPDFTTAISNRGSLVPVANGLAQPTAVSIDGGRTFVADWPNNRVLGFPGAPPAFDPTADAVAGQPDFQSRDSGLAANRLDSPRHTFAHQGRLYVADKENNRVLIWDSIPSGDADADRVLGQTTFTDDTAGAGPSGLFSPNSVFVVGDRLLVADQRNHRVLIWNSLPSTNGAPADLVLGQPDFTTTTGGTTRSMMDAPVALWSDGTRLAVADYTNHRILIWLTFPTGNFAPADVVVGQSDFTSGAPGSGPAQFTWPAGVTSDGDRLFIADASNNRILIYEDFPTQSGASADGALGQSDLFHTERNDDDQDGVDDGAPTARTLYSPSQITAHGGYLYVPDFHNHRVVVYDAP